MDSTAITLFDNILKGVGCHPKSGMKVHTMKKCHVGDPHSFVVLNLLQKFRHIVKIWERIAKWLRHIIEGTICSYTHWLCVVADCIFNE